MGPFRGGRAAPLLACAGSGARGCGLPCNAPSAGPPPEHELSHQKSLELQARPRDSHTSWQLWCCSPGTARIPGVGGSCCFLGSSEQKRRSATRKVAFLRGVGGGGGAGGPAGPQGRVGVVLWPAALPWGARACLRAWPPARLAPSLPARLSACQTVGPRRRPSPAPPCLAVNPAARAVPGPLTPRG